jgi:RNA-binding protein FUS
MEYVDHMARPMPKLDYGLYASVGPTGVYGSAPSSSFGLDDMFRAQQAVGKFGRQGPGGANRFAPYAGGQSGASKSSGRPGDWECQSCQNYNYASRSNCNRCHLPKPADEGGGAGTGGLLDQPTAASSSGGNGGGGGGGGGAGTSKPGDWLCPACKNNNYASRVQCNRCQLPKPLEFKNPLELGGIPNFMHPNSMPNGMMGGGGMGMGMMGGMGGMGMPRFSGLGPPNFGMGGMTPGPGPAGGMRPGDWLCRACHNHNFASREVCNKCKISKDVFVAKSGMKEGDWICASCNNHNFRDKVNCNKCRQPKPAPLQVAPGTPPAGPYVPQ